MFEKPTAAQYDDLKGTVCLKINSREQDYLARGAIVWPSALENGIIVVGLQSLFTRHIIINEQIEFDRLDMCITNGTIKEGAVQIFNRIWDMYCCDKYFVAGDSKTHFQYAVKVRKNFQTKKKPGFHYLQEGSLLDYTNSLMIQLSREGKLSVQKESVIEKQIKNPAGGQYGAIAFKLLIAGLERLNFKVRSTDMVDEHKKYLFNRMFRTREKTA